jgi:hypothetical protein
MLDFFLTEVSCVNYDDLIRGVPLSYETSREVEEWATCTAHSVMTTIVLGSFVLFSCTSVDAEALVVSVADQKRCASMQITSFCVFDLQFWLPFAWPWLAGRLVSSLCGLRDWSARRAMFLLIWPTVSM